MDHQYLMGSNSVLVKTDANTVEITYVNERLIRNLRKQAIREALGFYNTFFGGTGPTQSLEALVDEYETDLDHARCLDLFAGGGVREKDHLNYWCLGRAFKPQWYIESGVYIGSSLHAFVTCPGLLKVIAIDPNLEQLRVPASDMPDPDLVDDRDFSQLKLPNLPARTLAYFDDHINTADRIWQSHQKGLKYLLFDDSTGFEGTAQRLYPPVPTIPMIMNCDLLTPNDQMSWTFCNSPSGQKSLRFKDRLTGRKQKLATRVTLNITENLIDNCRRARSLIGRCVKIPDLGQFISQPIPEKMVDTSKYLLQLA